MFFRRLPSFPPPGGEGAQHSGTKARAEARPVDPVPDTARDQVSASATPPAASPLALAFAKADAQIPKPLPAWLTVPRDLCITCSAVIPVGAFYCPDDRPEGGL